MHDEEIRVIDVQLYGLEEVLHGLLLCAVPIDKVFAGSAEYDLAGDADLGVFFEADGRLLLVFVVEDDGDAGFRYSGLPTLVDEILLVLTLCCCLGGGCMYLEILRAHSGHIRNS